MAVALDELLVTFGSDTSGFERGAKRVEDKLKEVGETAEHTADKLQKINANDAILKSQQAILKMQNAFAKADADINKYSATTRGAATSSASFGDQVRSIGANLANIKAGLDIARDVGGFFFDLAKGAAEAGSKFHDLSLQTGVSVETFSGLQLQLKQSGTDMDALARAAVFLQKNLGEAASGNKELQHAFASLGIKDVRAALTDTDGSLRTVIKSLGEMKSAGERNAAGSKVMGKGFKELSVFLADTGGNLDDVIERARRAGQVMSTESANAADEFGDQLDALTNSVSVASRGFAMEFVPEITGGMNDVTGALQDNGGQWRQWGKEVADVIHGVREMAHGELGDIAGFLAKLLWNASPVGRLEKELAYAGAQAREAERQRQVNDPNTAISAVAGIQSAAMIGLAKSMMGAPKSSPSDFFSPEAKAKRSKDRKDELDKLKAFAKEWDFTVTALMGGKHNTGSAHYQGRAMDVRTRGKSEQEIEAFMAAARQAGYGVRDERVKPEGQKVWSGPHLHLELQSKATRAAVEAETKAFDQQQAILDDLSRALADANLEQQSFTRSTADQAVAVEYQRLGIGKLTGEAQALGEQLFALLEPQIRGKVAAEEYGKALEDLAEQSQKSWWRQHLDELIQPGTPTTMKDAPSAGGGLDLSNVQVDYWKDFREQFREIRDNMKSWREEWQDGLLDMAQNGGQIFADMFMRIGDGWKSMLGGLALDFARTFQQMASQAAASALWGALLSFAGKALGGGVGSHLPGANVGGGVFASIPFAGFHADGGFIPPGHWGILGERGPEPVFGGRTGATVLPNESLRGGGKVVHVTQNVTFHVVAPGGNIPQPTQAQMARQTRRALDAAREHWT